MNKNFIISISLIIYLLRIESHLLTCLLTYLLTYLPTYLTYLLTLLTYLHVTYLLTYLLYLLTCMLHTHLLLCTQFVIACCRNCCQSYNVKLGVMILCGSLNIDFLRGVEFITNSSCCCPQFSKPKLLFKNMVSC